MYNNKDNKTIKKKLYIIFLVIAMLIPLISSNAIELINISNSTSINAYAKRKTKSKSKSTKRTKPNKNERLTKTSRDFKKKQEAKVKKQQAQKKAKEKKKRQEQRKKQQEQRKKQQEQQSKNAPAAAPSSSSDNSSNDSDDSSSGHHGKGDNSHGLSSKKKLTYIQRKLWTQANLYNPNVPAGTQASIAQALEYDPKMQVLVTYSILRNKAFYTGTKGYSALYDNGKHTNGNPKDLISEFNDQNVGMKLPKNLGNQKILKDLSHYKATDKQMSKSSQVTSAAPDGDNKNTANSNNDGARSEAAKAGKWLATQALKATSLSDSREPTSDTRGTASFSDRGQLQQNHHGIKNGLESWVNDVTQNNEDPGRFHGVYYAKYSQGQLSRYATNKITYNAYYKYMCDVATEYVNSQINKNAGKNGKQIKKVIQNLSGNSFVSYLHSHRKLNKGFSEVSGSDFLKFNMWTGTIRIPVQGNHIKAQTRYINLWAANSISIGAWRQRYNRILSKKVNNNVSLDSDKLNKVAKDNANAKAQDDKDIGDDKGIGWNWITPHSAAWNKTQQTNKSFMADGDGNLMYPSKKDGITQVSPAALAVSKKGKSGKEFAAYNDGGKYPVYAYLNGKSGSLKGGRLNLAQGNKSGDNNIIQQWQKIFHDENFGDIGVNDHILGYDTYGNLIDGQVGPHVVVPYWQNWSIKQFDNPNIKVGPNGFGSTNFSVSKINSFLRKNGSKDSGNSTASDISQGNFGSGSSLSNKQAAELAIAITAETQNKVKQINKQMLSISKSNEYLYIGKSNIDHNNHASHSGSGTYLYTATDIIQRAGLATDYGFFDSIRKTIVAGLVNTYNNGFIQSGQQDIFHTTTSSETGVYDNLGLLPFYIITGMLGLVYLYILTNQVFLHRYTFNDSKRYLTALLKVILIGMLFIANPIFDQWALNKPGEILINKSIKQESVLDQWSDLRQEQSINNVLYSGLFGETFGQINTSQSYTLKFYTTTYKGSANAQDKQNNKGPNTKAVNDKSATSRDALKNMSDNQKAALKGNGKVGLMAPYQYKTVNVAATDLISWAAHMDRQLKTAQQQSGQTDANGQQVTGYKNTEMTEQPNGNYAPGQTPLFVWLDKYYQPLGSRAKSRGGKKYGTTIEGVSYGSGDSAYGKRRNPADTSLKSAYRTGLARNQENDNGDKYKGLSKYTEFAVNTKHYATDLDKQYGIDQDSANKANTDIQDNQTVNGQTGGNQGASDGNTDPSTMLTASQLFLRIWETTFSTIGTNQNDPSNNTDNKANQVGESTKGVENYNALARFAAAMRGMEIDTGDDSGSNAANNPANGGNVTTSQASALQQGDIGAVGRRDLINELSMTTAQRAANNGGDGSQFSKAASQVIDAFKIPKPTHDWLNLEDSNSPLDVLHPYYGKKQHEVRDGLINKINKKFLNDYVNIYSTVRFETDNTEAGNDTDNSQNDSNNNNANANNSDQQATINDENDSTGNNNDGDEDSFSMAEAHMLALDEFFTINKMTHERMFPQRFTPSSISLDSWNRMLLIPIAQMKQRDDNSQYEIWEDKVNPASIALQDNVAEYIGLRSTIPALFMFIVMNIALIIFGKLLSFMIAVVFPILLIFSLIRAFFKKDTKISNILFGALACKLILGIMKFILIFTYAYMSSSMNNAFVNSNGQMTLPVLQNCSIITLEIILFFLFLIKVYMPAVGKSLFTFGAIGGTAFGLSALFRNMHTNNRAMLSHVPGFGHMNLRGGIHGLRNGGLLAFHTIMNAGKTIRSLPHKAAVSLGTINGHVQNIGHAMKNGKMTSDNVIRDIHTRSWHDWLSSGKNVLVDHYRGTKGVLAQRVNNLENAYHTGFNRVYRYGTPKDIVDNAPNGTLLQTIKNPGALTLGLRDLPNFDQAQLPAIQRLIRDGKIKDVQLRGDKLVFHNTTADMLNTQDGRQKLIEPLTIAIQQALDSTTARLKVASLRQPTFGSFDSANKQIGIGVGNDMDVNPDQFKDFLSDMNVAGWKLANNVARDANGKLLANQQLHFVPKNKLDSANMQKFFNHDLQRIVGNHLASNAAANARNTVVNAGTASTAMKIAKKVPGATVVGTQVLVGQKGLQALNKVVADMNNVTASDHQMFANLGKGLTDYSHGGIGHGFSEAKFAVDKNGQQITQFRNNNAQTMSQTFKAARHIAGQNAYSVAATQARQAADKWDTEFAKANGNNVFKQTQALQSAIQNTKTLGSLDDHQRQLIRNMNNAARNFGTNGFKKLTDKQKAKAINDYESLVDGLQHSANWNAIQNNISANSPSQELHAANNAQISARSDILGMAPNGEQLLGNMGTRELTETLNTLSNLKMSDNSNGITEFKGSLSDAGIKRIQRLINRAN